MVRQPMPEPEPRRQEYPQGTSQRHEERLPLGASAASAVTFLAGVWLVLTPFVLDYAPSGSGVGASWNDLVVGVAVAVLAVVRTVAPADVPWFSIVNVALGAWLVVAPFVLEYASGANAGVAIGNDLAVGVVVIVLAATSAVATYGHRHRRTGEHRS